MRPSSIIRSDDLRNENRHRLLSTLRRTGPCSPARLKGITGLSAASISTLSSQMIDQGILVSSRSPASRDRTLRGRPRSQLSLNQSAGHVVTLTLTIDRVRVQLVNYAGSVCQMQQRSLDTRALSTQQLIREICQCVDTICQLQPDLKLHHIGVAFQGATEHASGCLLWSPIIRVQNVPLGKHLHARYGVTVSVNSDSRLISEALSRSHSQRLGNTFATVLYSHGVGLGLILNGQPFVGTRSSALELGHLRFEPDGALCRCGKRGCIEAYAAGYGIARNASGQNLQANPAGRVSASEMDALVADAQAGLPSALQAFRIAGTAVGEGLVTLFTLLDPMPVALVGLNDAAFDLMRHGMESVLDAHLRNGPAAAELLHYFNHEDPFLEQGLIDNCLSCVDQLLANHNTDISITG
ncbi:MAG: ROK family transcriptional regulator [Granulosicoccus sp.]|nr:ROK family transcriptional regulator [Granulosicoccus sp.]